MINQSIDELESELDRFGRPVSLDAGVRNKCHLIFQTGFYFGLNLLSEIVMFLSIMYQAQLYTILELCRAFDQIFKEHLDGG